MGKKELLAIGMAAGMEKKKCECIADQIETLVHDMLGEWL